MNNKYRKLIASILIEGVVDHEYLEYAEALEDDPVYIETDYFSDSSTDKISIMCEATKIPQNSVVYGTSYTEDETIYETLSYSTTNIRGFVVGKSSPNNAIIVNVLDNKKYVFIRDKFTYYINGAPSRNVLNSQSLTKQTRPICLFSRTRNSTQSFVGKIYKILFEPMDDIGRFLVPVRVIETNTVCYFCLFTKKYYYPQSGTLIAGPVKQDFDYYGNAAEAVSPTSNDSFIGTFNAFSQTKTDMEIGIANLSTSETINKAIISILNPSTNRYAGMSVVNGQIRVENGGDFEDRPVQDGTNIIRINNNNGTGTINGETVSIPYTNASFRTHIKQRLGIRLNSASNTIILDSGITDKEIVHYKEWDSTGNLLVNASPIRITKNNLQDIGGREYSFGEYALWDSISKEALPMYSTFIGRGGGDIGEFLLNDYGIEVDHLTSSGVEFIKTNIRATPETSVEVTFKSPKIGGVKNVSIFGGRTNYDNADGVSLFYFDVTRKIRYDSGLSLTNSIYTPAVNEWITTKQSRTENFYNGLVDTAPQAPGTTGSDFELYLFAVNSLNVATILDTEDLAIKAFKVWENDILIADYQPIKLTKQSYGTYPINSYLMLDKITNTIPVHIGNFQGE